jgi:hypothetical protein
MDENYHIFYIIICTAFRDMGVKDRPLYEYSDKRVRVCV